MPHTRLRAARRLSKRAIRAGEGRFLAEGPQAVREALGLPGTVVEVFATAECAARHPALAEAAAAGGVPWYAVPPAVLSSIAQTVTPQGVVAVCHFVDRPLGTLLAERGGAGGPQGRPLVVVCADVRDPGNAGTVIRCADAAGADGVVLAGSSVDPYNGKCVRASAGSLFHLPVVSGPPVADAVSGLREAGLAVVAADASGDVDLYRADDAGLLGGPVAWLFGNEARGLPAGFRDLADAVVRVPLYGRAESLNLATAAAVCLYATARAQRRDG